MLTFKQLIVVMQLNEHPDNLVWYELINPADKQIAGSHSEAPMRKVWDLGFADKRPA